MKEDRVRIIKSNGMYIEVDSLFFKNCIKLALNATEDAVATIHKYETLLSDPKFVRNVAANIIQELTAKCSDKDIVFSNSNNTIKWCSTVIKFLETQGE